jgi:2-alkyl-3-oxoalkanoate reductase
VRIFLAGATGVIGRRLVPALIAAGHDVVGTTRDAQRAAALQAAGAQAVIVDGDDLEALSSAVVQAEPEIVINQLTALSSGVDMRHLDRSLAATNVLRTVATDQLLAGAVKAGARRYIAQSFTGWTNPHLGNWVVTEDAGLDPEPHPATRRSIAAIAHLEHAVTHTPGIEGVVLRYGLFYGPGTSLGPGGDIYDLVARRQLPIIGGGRGVWSFLHADDATGATLAAVEHGAAGLYNITDDEPAPVAQWLPYLAEAIGAPPPRRLPAWVARPLAGGPAVAAMTAGRGSSNAKARRELHWQPRYPSWREGFRDGM